MKTRFAPSPTGFLHLGSVRTAFFAWLLARHNKGTFCLRIEDTDVQRSKPEYTDLILNTMQWLGLEWDGPVEYQSKRYDSYNKIIDELLSDQKAYHCHCSTERLNALRQQQKADGESHGHYDGACRDKQYEPATGSVVRLKIPVNAQLDFIDELHGPQTPDRSTVDDWIIRRSDGHPTYNFAVVVDDYEMDITHVVRGDDHLNNTPKQISLYQLMNWPIPLFYHIPMILDEAGGRLSKRSGSANILQYREQGYLPAALLNALVRMGWSHGNQELFSIEEMITFFDGHNLQRSAASFNTEKFHWVAKQWMMNIPATELLHYALDEKFLENAELGATALNLVQQRIKNMSEIAPMTAFLSKDPTMSRTELLKDYAESDLEQLQRCIEHIKQSEITQADAFFPLLKAFCKTNGLAIKNLAFPLRHILTGTPHSPDLGAIIQALSLSVVFERIQKALTG